MSELFRKVKITEGTFEELCTDRIVSTSFFVRSVLVCAEVERLPSRLSGGGGERVREPYMVWSSVTAH